jgi:hypothetical protein
MNDQYVVEYCHGLIFCMQHRLLQVRALPKGVHGWEYRASGLL